MKKKNLFKIDLKAILIFLIVLVKYLKMENMVSNTISNIVFFGLLFIIVIIIIRKRILRNFDKGWFIFSIGIALIQLFFLYDVDLLVLISMSLIFADDDDAIKKIIKYYLISLILVYLINLVLFKLGYARVVLTSRLIDGNIVQRNALGFKHPNRAYMYYFFAILASYYLFKSRLKYTIIVIVTSYFMYRMTLSRTGIICTIIFLILIWLYNNKIKINKYMFIIGTGVTFLVAICFGNINNKINVLLSNRPYIYNYYITNGFLYNIIGKNLTHTLDSTYLNLIIDSGWIIYIYYFFLYFSSGKILEKDRKLSVIFIITLIYGCLETYTINIGVNFLLLIQMYSVITIKNQFKEFDKNEENKNITSRIII